MGQFSTKKFINQQYADRITNSIILCDYYNSLKELKISDFMIIKANLDKSYQLLSKFKFNLNNTINNKFLLELIDTPFNFMTEHILWQESLKIDNEWQNEVLPNSINSNENISKISNEYMNKIDIFIKNKLKDYLEISNLIYTPKSFYVNFSFPFSVEFISFINHLKEYDSLKEIYDIKVENYPISINNKSNAEPYQTSLIINCLPENIQIDNFNYKDIKTFQWNINSCSDAKLRIVFEDFEIIKKYQDNLGFVYLIKDLKDNSYVLTKDFFPEYKDLLDKYNIQFVNLGFKFDGDISQILRLLKPIEYKIPQKIIRTNNVKQ